MWWCVQFFYILWSSLSFYIFCFENKHRIQLIKLTMHSLMSVYIFLLFFQIISSVFRIHRLYFSRQTQKWNVWMCSINYNNKHNQYSMIRHKDLLISNYANFISSILFFIELARILKMANARFSLLCIFSIIFFRSFFFLSIKSVFDSF